MPGGTTATPRGLRTHDCIVIRENDQAFNNWQLSDGREQILVKVRTFVEFLADRFSGHRPGTGDALPPGKTE